MKKTVLLIVACVFLFAGCTGRYLNRGTGNIEQNHIDPGPPTRDSEREHIDSGPPRMLNFSSMEEWVGLIDSTALQDGEFTDFIDEHHYSMNGINSKQDVVDLKSRLDTASYPILERFEFDNSTIYMERGTMDLTFKSNSESWIRFDTYFKGSSEFEDAKSFFEKARSQGYVPVVDAENFKLLYRDIEQERDIHHYKLNVHDVYFRVTVYEAKKHEADYWLTNLSFTDFDEFISKYTKREVLIHSDGQSIKPYELFAYSYEYDEEHGGIYADGVSMDSELQYFADELQTVVLSEDFEVILAERQEITNMFVFSDSYERIDDMQTDLSQLPKGTYYVGVLVTEQGRYIESEQKNEYEGVVNCFKLIVDDVRQGTQDTEPPGYVEAEDIINKLSSYAHKMSNCNAEQLVFTAIEDDAVAEEINLELGLSAFTRGYYNSDGYIMFYEDDIQPSELSRALEQSTFIDNYQYIWGTEGGDFDVVLIFADNKCGEEISDVIYNIVVGRY